MQKIFILLTFISLNLFGSCLKVSATAGRTCSGNDILVENINKNFTTNMKVSDVALTVVDIPLYVFSDSTDSVSMTISTVSRLRNSSNEIINTTFEYVQNGVVLATIIEGTPFQILSANSGFRNGNTIIGYIRIRVNTLSSIQTAGDYSLSKNMTVALGSGSPSVSALLTSTGTVEYVTMVSFVDDIRTYTIGENFKDVTIDYGSFDINVVNIQSRNLYVKNNTNNNITVSFSPSDLVSQIDSAYRVSMSYSYRPNSSGSPVSIVDATAFTVAQGKQEGDSVGVMDFKTEEIPDTLIAGEYRSMMAITVTAR